MPCSNELDTRLCVPPSNSLLSSLKLLRKQVVTTRSEGSVCPSLPQSLPIHDPPHPSFLSQKSEFLFTPGLTPLLLWLIILCAGYCARSWGRPPTAHRETIPTLMECPCSWGGQAGSVLWFNKIINHYSSNLYSGRCMQGGDREQEGESQWIMRSGRSFWAGVLWAEAGGGERAGLCPCRGHVLGEDGGPRSCRACQELRLYSECLGKVMRCFQHGCGVIWFLCWYDHSGCRSEDDLDEVGR